MRLNQNTEQIKAMVDVGTMAMIIAVELSYLSEKEQQSVCKVASEQGIKIKYTHAEALRKEAGSLTDVKIMDILASFNKEEKVSDVEVFTQIKRKYFEGKTSKEMINILECALEAWFAKEAELDV